MNKHYPHFLLYLVAFACLFSCSNKKGTYSLADYGAVVNDPNFDNGPALQALLADVYKAAERGQPLTILLPEGDLHVYAEQLPTHTLYISNHDHHDTRKVAMMLEGLEHLTVKGDGTHFQYHGTLIPFVVSMCQDVTLEGFTIDYPQPTVTQLEFKEIDPDTNTILAEVLGETDYLIRDNRLCVVTEADTVNVYWALPFGSDGHMKWGRSDVSFNPQAIEEVGPHQLRLTNWPEIAYLREGDIYVLRAADRPTPGIVISDSYATTIKEVKVHFADGMGLLAQSATDITLDGFEVALEEGSQRHFTTIADATHFSGCRGAICSTNGLYENMADDAINVHGTYLRLDSISTRQELFASFAHHQTFGIPWYYEGDTLRFISRETLLPIDSMAPTTVEFLSPKELRITLPRPLTVSGEELAVENLSAYPSVLFADNVIRNNRARGALFSTAHRVECRDNLFDHTHGSAILLTGDANGWFESGPCQEVLIEGNHFVNALTGLYQFTEAIISIAPQMRRLEQGQYYHGTVIIRNNRFDNYPVPLFYAKSTEQLFFVDNAITTNTDYPQLFEETASRQIEVGTLETDLDSNEILAE